MRKDIHTTTNAQGQQISIHDTGDEIKVWNNEEGEMVGTAGDEENARLLAENS